MPALAAILAVKVLAEEQVEALEADVAETAGTDEVELRGFDNKCILEYFKEKEFLSIVKEWKTKGGKQLERQNEKLEKRQQEKLKKMQPDVRNKSNKEQHKRQQLDKQQQAAAQEAAAKAAEEARQKAEQERLAAIEEQRRKDAEAAAQQRQAQAQALGTVVTTGPGSLNRPADPLPKYRGYTPLDYDVSKTGSLTDQYARMLNVPFFQPFIAQEDINLAPGATTADSIFGVESLLPNYTFDPLSQTASNPYFSARQGGRVQKDMGGFIGFMDEPLNIMHPTTKIDVVDGGISSILKKYKEIRSEL